MSAQQLQQLLFPIFAFLFGAAVGSFLNVCIYRLPRELSVNQPRRSFCPSCKYQIPWSSNLPLITWLIQGGKCKNCGAPISVRYFLVELLTGLLFLATWWRVTATSPFPADWLRFIPLAVFVALLIVATFIDFEHFIIPDGITWGGAAAGIAFSLAIPQLHGERMGDWIGHLRAGAWSLAAAAIGFALLWVISVLGKAAFGRKTLNFNPPEPFTWTHDHEKNEAKLTVGKDVKPWEELFTNDKDMMHMKCTKFVYEGKTCENLTVNVRYLELHLDDKVHDLQKATFFSGVVEQLSFNRDAMGFGDVKFIACIGAFLGWKSVFFTVMAGSVIGATVALTTIALGRREWSAKIPFGPYLSLGALIWLFQGPELIDWYLNLVAPPDPDLR